MTWCFSHLSWPLWLSPYRIYERKPALGFYHQLDKDDSFVSVGSRVSSDCSSEAEICRRHGLSRSAFDRLSCVLRSKKVHISTKIRIIYSCVLPVLFFGCESSDLSASTTRRLTAYHRHLHRILWFHHIRFMPKLALLLPYPSSFEDADSSWPRNPARQVLAASSRPSSTKWRCHCGCLGPHNSKSSIPHRTSSSLRRTAGHSMI